MQTRPKDIERYAYIQIAVIVVGFINGLINWDALVAVPGNSPTQQILTQAISYAITLTLLYFIVMKASNVARWISVVLIVLGSLVIIPILTMDSIPVPGGKAMPVILSIATLGSLWFLFTPAAKNWFSKNPDHNVFS